MGPVYPLTAHESQLVSLYFTPHIHTHTHARTHTHTHTHTQWMYILIGFIAMQVLMPALGAGG